jgi:hypothetical protein
MKDILDAQQQHWQKTFIQKLEMFGSEPSEPARVAAELFDKEGKTRILELGGGQGATRSFLPVQAFMCMCWTIPTARLMRSGTKRDNLD